MKARKRKPRRSLTQSSGCESNGEARETLLVQCTGQIRTPVAIAGAGKQASCLLRLASLRWRDIGAPWGMNAGWAAASTGVEIGPLPLTPCEAVASVRHVAIVNYASWMSPPATLLIWFQLRSPELAEDFERLMTEDRDIVRGSLDTLSDWRLTRPVDVPGQSIGQADYVLIAEIVEVERFEQQASEHVQRLADDLAHLVSSRGMLIVRPVL
jgi:hypothetical protein